MEMTFVSSFAMAKFTVNFESYFYPNDSQENDLKIDSLCKAIRIV